MLISSKLNPQEVLNPSFTLMFLQLNVLKDYIHTYISFDYLGLNKNISIRANQRYSRHRFCRKVDAYCDLGIDRVLIKLIQPSASDSILTP